MSSAPGDSDGMKMLDAKGVALWSWDCWVFIEVAVDLGTLGMGVSEFFFLRVVSTFLPFESASFEVFND